MGLNFPDSEEGESQVRARHGFLILSYSKQASESEVNGEISSPTFIPLNTTSLDRSSGRTLCFVRLSQEERNKPSATRTPGWARHWECLVLMHLTPLIQLSLLTNDGIRTPAAGSAVRQVSEAGGSP